MKIADVVNQLAKIIPQLSDMFSDTLGIVSISGNGTIVSVETDVEHGLINNEFINVVDVTKENVIIGVTFSTVNGLSILEIETAVEHDLIFNEKVTTPQVATFTNFTDGAWNATLNLVAVLNRFKFKVVNGTAAEPVFNSNELLLEVVAGEFNGPQTVTVVDTTNLTYTSILNAVGNGGKIRARIRIAGIVNLERAVDQYSINVLESDKFYMFVAAPTSVDANKSRSAQTDNINESVPQNWFYSNIRDGFIILIFANVSDESGGLNAMDILREEIFSDILLSVRGVKFNSGLECPPNGVTEFLSHGTLQYNPAYYVHQYLFEVPIVLTRSDALQPITRAFRDIDFTNSVSKIETVGKLTAKINLDNDM